MYVVRLLHTAENPSVCPHFVVGSTSQQWLHGSTANLLYVIAICLLVYFQLRGVVQEQLQDLPVPSILLKCLSCEFLKLCTFVQVLPMVLCYRISQEFIHL